MRQITFAPTFSAWQQAAREALVRRVPPQEIVWVELGDDAPPLPLFDESDDEAASLVASGSKSPPAEFRVPKDFMAMAQRVACHRDPRRWALLYGVLWRLTHGEPRLLDIVVDPAVHELAQFDKSVRHDIHKMRAFVRFRLVTHQSEPWYVAWFEPAHHIVEMNAPFFRDRFAQMHWSILTPDRCMHWDGSSLSFTEGVPKSEAPADDAVEALWLAYYGHIFNPARVKEQAMLSEMPKRYWKNLPEAALIPALLNDAPLRVKKMRKQSAAKTADHDEDGAAAEGRAQPPESYELHIQRKAARDCRACPLWKNATQTVFGEGSADATLVIVGEQPGDSEDLDGHPFVGPAGKLLDRALVDAGIDRSKAYVTNAVKHFKWEPRGKRRLHAKPNAREIAACRPWLLAELGILRPKVVICLGATAATSVFARTMRVLSERGHLTPSPLCEQTMITVHPSMLLRLPDEAARDEQYGLFVKDLRKAAAAIAEE